MNRGRIEGIIIVGDFTDTAIPGPAAGASAKPPADGIRQDAPPSAPPTPAAPEPPTPR